MGRKQGRFFGTISGLFFEILALSKRPSTTVQAVFSSLIYNQVRSKMRPQRRRMVFMALEKELETYKNKLPELQGNEGKFVLIRGDQVVDMYSSYEDAIKEGYAKFGVNSPFLVKQIQAVQQVQFISRFVDPCHTSLSK